MDPASRLQLCKNLRSRGLQHLRVTPQAKGFRSRIKLPTRQGSRLQGPGEFGAAPEAQMGSGLKYFKGPEMAVKTCVKTGVNISVKTVYKQMNKKSK
jgi:hypothetical protein